MDKYTNALRRLYIGAGATAGSIVTWFVSELKDVDPLAAPTLIMGTFAVVALVDAWRTR